MANKVDAAFDAIHRADFLPADIKDQAFLDMPLAIGYGQTNSQPSTVRLMLEWLSPQPGDKILDVGSGSGWTSALLGHIVGPKGKVFAVERIPELVKFGQENIKHTKLKNIQFSVAGKTYGLPKNAPYDRILVSAAATEIPQTLLAQLKVGGRLIIPVKSSIFVIDKTGPDEYTTCEKPGFAFVPLV